MFEKSLQDVVKGIRSSKRDTALYISQCIAEIKAEINSADMAVKANGLQKLTFLQMMGYSMSWASFATIEVMSSTRFAHKRIGYLAATQGFTQGTDVILLATNLLKKELRGAVGGGMHGVYEAGLAINCVANIVTEDLARDLLADVTHLTKHAQPYLRKKAILCLFKLFVKYPQGLRLTFAKLQECLEDSNQSVVSCAVNVITELSDKNPKNYLPLAPAFFELLTGSSNNWMLIKVVKLLGSLVPEEPRLARKLLEPLADIVRNTQAKSLQFEAVYTITLCLPYCAKADGSMPSMVPDIVTLSAETLHGFVEDNDQNLKYLGLVGFGSLMQSHPRVLSAPSYRPLILACLSDLDVTIRTRALDLLSGMVTRKNLQELVTQLLQHVEMARGTYKNDLVAKIVEMCASEKYSLIADFGWYLNILFRLGHMRGVDQHAELLRAQVTDVALRVLPIRTFAVRRSMEVLLEGDKIVEAGKADDDHLFGDNGRGKHVMHEILPATAWIIGEYADLIREADNMDGDGIDDEAFAFDEQSKGTYHAVVQALTDPWNTKRLPASTQKLYVQAGMKVFAAATADASVSDAELEACLATIHANLPIYIHSPDVEVLERAFTAVELLKSLGLVGGNLSSQLVSVPGLMAVGKDERSDEDQSESDLLGMDGAAGGTAPSAPRPQVTEQASSAPLALAAKARSVSDTLNYLLKPSPMKPIGAKAQRKKHANPINVSSDLKAPINLSLFDELVQEEERERASKLSLESVSFTQQHVMHVADHRPTGSIGVSSIDVAGTSNGARPGSFQRMGSGIGATVPLRNRDIDPFYLESAPASDGEAEQQDKSARFGTIQLIDSDDDDGGKTGKPGKKKKKEKNAKKDRKAKEEPQAPAEASALDDDAFWSSLQTPAPAAAAVAANINLGAPADMAVYESDSSGGGDVGQHKRRFEDRKKAREFQGLANVDLTMPLRQDEVMPEHKHRVVLNKPVPEAGHKSRKDKKKKRSKKDQANQESIELVADLLDLADEFCQAPPTSTPAEWSTNPAPALVANSINPVDNAFDDLLGLSAPPTEPPPAPPSGAYDLMGSPPETVNRKAAGSSKRPWMRATLKSSNDGSADTIRWNQVSLLYRVYAGSDGTTAKLVFRLDNGSATALTNVRISLKNLGNGAAISNVAAAAHAESEKVGPCPCVVDDSTELKGKLSVDGSSVVSLKLSIPATLQLNPQEGLSLDQVQSELASKVWSADAAKVRAPHGTSLDGAVASLAAFFRAAIVSTNGHGATLASQSASGASVRFLVKQKSDSFKIDVKATNAKLAAALASDVKRLVL